MLQPEAVRSRATGCACSSKSENRNHVPRYSLGPNKADDTAWYEARRDTVLLTLGGVFGTVGLYQWKRSDAAATAASETQEALGLEQLIGQLKALAPAPAPGATPGVP